MEALGEKRKNHNHLQVLPRLRKSLKQQQKKSPDESSQRFYSLIYPFCFSSEVSFPPFSIDKNLEDVGCAVS